MVDKEKQHRIDELFVAACEIPQSQLKEFLDQACGNDAEVRTAVERLLAADRELHLDDQNLAGAPIGGIVKEVQDAAEEAVGQAREIEAGAADRNLLFGIVALQMNFIGRDALIRAMNAWVLNKTQPIENILVEHGEMGEKTNLLLGALVDKHLEYHDHNPVKSLAALSSVADIKQSLEGIQDTELTQSIVHLGSDSRKSPDTPTISFGEQTKKGGRFRVLRPHKEGGLGAVSVALDEELNREVALKEVLKKYSNYQSAHDRLRVEAEITGGLEHPGIVPVYGLGSYQDGSPFYCMRFIRGDSLKDAIRNFQESKTKLSASSRNLELRGLLRRFIDVCDAVSYAHSRRVLHRDLKPGNIMLGKYGETLVVDWGLAKATATKQGVSESTELPIIPRSGSTAAPTMAGSTIGTPEYMSPEQAEGRIDQLGPATDVYSLGATLYCLLTGRPPVVEKETAEKLRKVRNGDFPRPTELDKSIPKALEAICLKAMELEPKNRYVKPNEIANDIERWLADEAVSVYSDPAIELLGRYFRRHRTVVLTIAAILATALIGLSVFNYVVRNKNKQLTKLNSELESAQSQLEEDFSNARKLAFAMVEQAESGETSLAQIPNAQKHRHWITNQSIMVFEPFLVRRPNDPDVKREMARLYRFAANLDRLNGDYGEAAIKYNSAIDLLEEIVSSNPGDAMSRDRLSLTLSDYAPMLRLAGRLEEGREQLEKSQEIIRSLRLGDPDSMKYRRSEGLVEMEFAVVLTELADPATGLVRSTNCSELFRQLVDSEQRTDNDEILLVFSLVKESELLRDLRRFDEAEAVSRRAVERARKADMAKSTRGSRHALAKAYLELGRVMSDQSANYDVFSKFIEDAISIWQDLLTKYSTSRTYPRYLAMAKTALGKAKFNNKQEAAGREDFEFAVRFMEKTIETQSDPSNLEALSDALFEFGLAEKLHGDSQNSEILIERATTCLKTASLQNKESKRLRSKLGFYQSQSK